MQATERWRTTALVTAALLAGSIIGPPLAQAVTASVVTIQGSGSTNKAKVTSTGELSVNPNLTTTGAGQVEAAAADPGKDVTVFAGPNCTSGGIYTIPAGQALIVTGVDFYTDANPTNSPHELDLTAGPTTAPCSSILAAGLAPSSEDHLSQNQVFDPGIAVPAGDAIGMTAFQDSGSAEFYGYLVPAADVPAAALQHTRAQGTIMH